MGGEAGYQTWNDERRARQRLWDAKSRANRSPESKAKKLSQVRAWKAANPEKVKSANRRRLVSNPINFLLKNVKYNAKVRGIHFALSPGDFPGGIPEKCPVLGIKINFPAKGKDGSGPSFDRIDNSKGYVPGNVRIISLRANTLKLDCVNPQELRLVARYIEESLGTSALRGIGF